MKPAGLPTDAECETPVEAGVPSTKGPTRDYPAEGITVVWNATRCIHSGRCIRGLPQVFDPARRPWIDATLADAEEIAAVVRTCPTGALTYRPGPGLEEERPEEPVTVQVRSNGPLFVRGWVDVVDARGEVLATEPRVALCRCGASANKPFCDNSHLRIEFRG